MYGKEICRRRIRAREVSPAYFRILLGREVTKGRCRIAEVAPTRG